MMPLLLQIAGRGTTWRAQHCSRLDSDPRNLCSHLAQRAESCADLFGERLRLLPGREVPALRQPVVVNQVGIGFLGPAPRRRIELVGKDTDASRERDALGGKEGQLAFPVQTRR